MQRVRFVANDAGLIWDDAPMPMRRLAVRYAALPACVADLPFYMLDEATVKELASAASVIEGFMFTLAMMAPTTSIAYAEVVCRGRDCHK